MLQGFLIRAFILPDEEYSDLKNKLRESNNSLEKLLKKWEKCYQDIFGEEEMIYNVHVWVSLMF